MHRESAANLTHCSANERSPRESYNPEAENFKRDRGSYQSEIEHPVRVHGAAQPLGLGRWMTDMRLVNSDCSDNRLMYASSRALVSPRHSPLRTKS